MLNLGRKFVERVFIGDSVPALVRWGKCVPPYIISGIQRSAFIEVVRYAAQRQRFFANKLRQHSVDAARVRRPEDLGEIFTTAEDLLRLPPEDFLCREPQAVFETTGTSGSPKRTYFGYD